MTPETVLLDVGTGSGILGILALMFGARSVVGTDLDPCAVEAVREIWNPIILTRKNSKC